SPAGGRRRRRPPHPLPHPLRAETRLPHPGDARDDGHARRAHGGGALARAPHGPAARPCRRRSLRGGPAPPLPPPRLLSRGERRRSDRVTADDPSRARPRRAALAFIFVTALLDMLALGVIVPVLPRLVVDFEAGDPARAAEVLGVFGTVWALMHLECS